MSDAVEFVGRLFRSIDTAEKLRTMTNAELADLLMEHVYADLEMTSPKSDLVAEVIDRLRGMKVCPECKGYGYIEHVRCGDCNGTGDVRV